MKIAPRDRLDRQARFDLVLCDAPCSGSGAWRRSPDGKWALTPDELARLNATQLQILETAADSVSASGRLAYATCSILSCENDGIVDRFLTTTTGWTCRARHRWMPGAQGDGFFLAVLQRA